MSFLPRYPPDHPGQSGTGVDFKQQSMFIRQVTCPLTPPPVFDQQSSPVMAIEKEGQTPHSASPEQATHDINPMATEDIESDPAPAAVVDYSWHLVATQGDHAMFGDGGILHGMEVRKRTTRNGHLTQRLFISPLMKHLCVPADVHGHNNLEVGQWFANRTIAYFHGAHGAFQPGIVGVEDGAFSVVITPGAGNPDVDHGYTVLYAGPEGHPGTRGLEKSHQTGNPVRVLRTAKKTGHWPWAPRAGIRYDGLYRVVGISGVQPATASASDGGTFRHFQMRRLPGQTPLEELLNTSPSGDEMDQFQDYHELLGSVVA